METDVKLYLQYVNVIAILLGISNDLGPLGPYTKHGFYNSSLRILLLFMTGSNFNLMYLRLK